MLVGVVGDCESFFQSLNFHKALIIDVIRKYFGFNYKRIIQLYFFLF